LIFIPSTLLVAFFRNIRQRRLSKQNSPINEAIKKLRSNQIFQSTKNFIKEKKNNRFIFPWWCLFIAYSLSFILISISILLIIARGIEFGEVKVQKWLASLIIAFFSSVFFSQPIKVCLCVVVFPMK
jgi:hypothetical protein